MRIAIIGLMCLVMSGCYGTGISEERSNNKDYKVERLFDHDGCAVYRFWDALYAHYYVDCYDKSSFVNSMINESKTQRPESVQTNYRD